METSEVKGKKIAIELLDGTRILGRVHSWGKTRIWVLEDGFDNPKEVPRDIIQRSLVLFEEVSNDEEKPKED